MKITEMNSTSADLVVNSAKAAMEEVAARFGLELEEPRGTYDVFGGTFSVNMTFICKNEAGIPATWIQKAPRWGFEPTDFGRGFTTAKGTYEICGIKPRSRKYPILAKCTRTGRIYKFNAQHALEHLNRAPIS